MVHFGACVSHMLWELLRCWIFHVWMLMYCEKTTQLFVYTVYWNTIITQCMLYVHGVTMFYTSGQFKLKLHNYSDVHNGCDGVSNHQPHHCLCNRLFRSRSKNIKALRHWPLCGEFTGDRWIPRTDGQQRGKCFHLMTSSWYICMLSAPKFLGASENVSLFKRTWIICVTYRALEMHAHIYVYVYICVCVCVRARVCVCGAVITRSIFIKNVRNTHSIARPWGPRGVGCLLLI